MQPFDVWQPDVMELGIGKGGDKLNVLPALNGWAPFPGMLVASVPVGGEPGEPEPEGPPSLDFSDEDNSQFIGAGIV
jgi:hypothetical protein